MITARPMKIHEIKKMHKLMREQYGSIIKGSFFINNKNKVFLVSELVTFDPNKFNSDGVGLYIGTIERDGFRLSIEGAQLINAKKNVLEIPDELVYDWTRGFKLKLKNKFKGYVVVKNKTDILGCGKSNGEAVLNYVPKPRRIQTYRKDAENPIDKT